MTNQEIKVGDLVYTGDGWQSGLVCVVIDKSSSKFLTRPYSTLLWIDRGEVRTGIIIDYSLVVMVRPEPV